MIFCTSLKQFYYIKNNKNPFKIAVYTDNSIQHRKVVFKIYHYILLVKMSVI